MFYLRPNQSCSRRISSYSDRPIRWQNKTKNSLEEKKGINEYKKDKRQLRELRQITERIAAEINKLAEKTKAYHSSYIQNFAN